MKIFTNSIKTDLIIVITATLFITACNKPPLPEGTPETNQSADTSQTIGTEVLDTEITAEVKTALLRDEGLKSLSIEVITTKGDVALTGFVEQQGQIDLAEKIVRGIAGVHSIHNNLLIQQATK